MRWSTKRPGKWRDLRRRIRIMAGNIQQMRHVRSLLSPLRALPLFFLLSHKASRLVAPFALLIAFAANAFLLGAPLYVGLFCGQAVFYLLALRGHRVHSSAPRADAAVLLLDDQRSCFFRFLPRSHKPAEHGMEMMRQCNIMSVDVEDYFQVEAFAGSVARCDWQHYASRVERNTQRILDLLDEYGVKATFFILGWVAEHYPRLVQKIVALRP